MISGTIKNKEYKEMSAIGRLSVGKRVEKNGVTYPVSIDYFRATGNYTGLFHDTFGDKPSQLEITFLSDEARNSCCNYYEIRKGAQVYARGDGSFFEVSDGKGGFKELAINEDFNESEFKVKIEKECNTEKIKAKWKSKLDLRFLIPGLKGVFGYWMLTTYGEATSINNIVSTFHKIKELTGSRIRGLPFNLSVKLHKSNTVGAVKRYPIIALDPLFDLEVIKKLYEAKQNKIELPFFIELENKKNKLEYKHDLTDFTMAYRIIDGSVCFEDLKTNMKIIKEKFASLSEEQLVFLREVAQKKSDEIRGLL